jgi:hypothetical protein
MGEGNFVEGVGRNNYKYPKGEAKSQERGRVKGGEGGFDSTQATSIPQPMLNTLAYLWNLTYNCVSCSS